MRAIFCFLVLFTCSAAHVQARPLIQYSTRVGESIIEVDARAFEAGPGEVWQLDLPNGDVRTFVVDRAGPSGRGTQSLVGHDAAGGAEFRSILTQGHGVLFGLIVTPEGNWTIEPRGGTSPSVIRPLMLPEESGSDMRAPIGNASTYRPSLAPRADAGDTVQADGDTVDIGLVYTQGLVDYYGLGLVTRMQQLINVLDQALFDSGTGLRARLAGATLVPTGWDELTPTDETIDDLVAGASFGHTGTESDVFGACTGGPGTCTNNGDLSSLLAFRDGAGADLVVMIRRLFWPEQRYCGIAFVPGFGGVGVIDPVADNVYGVAVVGVGPDGNGSGRDCTDLTFVHEVGHNLGLVHNFENSGATGGDQGVLPYSFAHRVDCSFRTAVGYDSLRSGVSCATRPPEARGNEVWLARFSNPAQSDCLGQVCGVEAGQPHAPGSGNDNTTAPADAARSIREQGRNTALFRPQASSVRSAILPYSRTVSAGTPATAFVSVINPASTGTTATGCGLILHGARPGEFTFQRTDPATNAPTGNPGDLADIAAGAVQTFVISLTRSGSEQHDDLAIDTACANRVSAPFVAGVNTLRFATTFQPTADIIALAATLDGNGIVSLPEGGGAGAFSVATSNLGAFGALDVSVERADGAPDFDRLDLCVTDPNTGQCITARAPVLRRDFAAGGTQTFAVFVRHAEPIANSPAVNRVFVHFRTTTGQSVGATSVAVRTR